MPNRINPPNAPPTNTPTPDLMSLIKLISKYTIRTYKAILYILVFMASVKYLGQDLSPNPIVNATAFMFNVFLFIVTIVLTYFFGQKVLLSLKKNVNSHSKAEKQNFSIPTANTGNQPKG